MTRQAAAAAAKTVTRRRVRDRNHGGRYGGGATGDRLRAGCPEGLRASPMTPHRCCASCQACPFSGFSASQASKLALTPGSSGSSCSAISQRRASWPGFLWSSSGLITGLPRIAQGLIQGAAGCRRPQPEKYLLHDILAPSPVTDDRRRIIDEFAAMREIDGQVLVSVAQLKVPRAQPAFSRCCSGPAKM